MSGDRKREQVYIIVCVAEITEKKEIILCRKKKKTTTTHDCARRTKGGGGVTVDGKYRHVERGNTHLSIRLRPISSDAAGGGGAKRATRWRHCNRKAAVTEHAHIITGYKPAKWKLESIIYYVCVRVCVYYTYYNIILYSFYFFLFYFYYTHTFVCSQ